MVNIEMNEGINSDWEREKAFQEICSLMRIREQKIRVNKTPVEERIKDIKKKYLRDKGEGDYLK